MHSSPAALGDSFAAVEVAAWLLSVCAMLDLVAAKWMVGVVTEGSGRLSSRSVSAWAVEGRQGRRTLLRSCSVTTSELEQARD